MSSALQFTGQIRLTEISVFNWGSFHGLHTAKIDAHGTLITGDNGSGKSTLIDGLMALLLPAGKASFNIAAAQGDRSDRTLISYMRGSYGSDHDGAQTKVKNKREGATHTAIRALYRGDDGSEVMLAALFWTTQASSALSDINKLYMLGRKDMPLKQLLEYFGQGNARLLKQQLRENPAMQLFDSGFANYRESYQRALHIENRNAPELLGRALGLKKIDDLTGLIRTLVLEPSHVREDARKAVNEFDDLHAIYRQMTDARQQVQALEELPVLSGKVVRLKDESKAIYDQLGGIGGFFAQQAKTLWTARLVASEQQQQLQQQQHQQAKLALEQAQQEENDRYADYRQAGGDKIESLRRDLKSAQEQLQLIVKAASDYQRVAAELGLDNELHPTTFANNLAAAQAQIDNSETHRTEAQDDFGRCSGTVSDLQNQLKELRRELTEVEARPDSNIPTHFQRLREELIQSLGLQKISVPFIGELIDIKEDQHRWQGAIERALGGLRTTLLVPADELGKVTGWVNARHTGVHVRLQSVGESHSTAQFKTDGFLRKLQWQTHPFRDWLKHHLSRFDLECVDSPEALRGKTHAMTVEGLIQHERGRFEKKDQQRINDRKHWFIGFSNQSRLAVLKQECKTIQQALNDATAALQNSRAALDAFEKQFKKWEQLHELQWSQVDLPTAQTRVERLEQDLDALNRQGGSLQIAEEIWQRAKAHKETQATSLEEKQKALWEVESAIERARSAITGCEARLATFQNDEKINQQLQQTIGEITDAQLDAIDELEREHTLALNQQKSELDAQCNRHMTRSVGIISRFRGRWTTIAADWGSQDFQDCQDYLEYLETLQNEGLPKLVKQFGKRLNLHTTQSLAAIREKIESEREEIRDRIDVINHVLLQTEFREGSYLRLKTRRENHAHVNDMEQRLKNLLSDSMGNNHESRFLAIKDIIEILDKASNPATAHTQESKRLLDPRFQMNFYAEEIDNETDNILDVLESSSGKSGGEKESFAGTVIAASLAYVLTPMGSDHPVYCTVFLDEAFSNTAEAVSRRVLKVFRELKIHINLITPYKNLNLARESARSLLIAERDAATHESRLCEVTWEEIDRQRLQHKAAVARQAQSLGIRELQP
jgi:uncharacterized protein YPO0396